MNRDKVNIYKPDQTDGFCDQITYIEREERFSFLFTGLQIDGNGIIREAFLKENREDTPCVG